MAFTDDQQTLIDNMVDAFFEQKKAASPDEYRYKTVLSIDPDTGAESEAPEDNETYQNRIKAMEDAWLVFIKGVLEPTIPVLLQHLVDHPAEVPEA